MVGFYFCTEWRDTNEIFDLKMYSLISISINKMDCGYNNLTIAISMDITRSFCFSKRILLEKLLRSKNKVFQ